MCTSSNVINKISPSCIQWTPINRFPFLKCHEVHKFDSDVLLETSIVPRGKSVKFLENERQLSLSL